MVATTIPATRPPVGRLLRGWRQHRRLSQLEVASEAAVSARHLSFVETGRSRPSRELVMHLADHLDVPLRERNTLLLAAGYAPAYAERALAHILEAHEPYPAVIVDRQWNLLIGNDAALELFTAGVADHLLEPPINA